MNHTKSKSLITMAIMLILVFCMTASFAATITREVKMPAPTVTLDGKTATNGQTYEGNYVGKTVNISVNPTYMDSSLKIYVKWGEQDAKVIKTGSKTASFTIPNMAAGESVMVQIQATIDNDAQNYVGRSDNFIMTLKMPDVSTDTDINAYKGSTKLTAGSTYSVEAGTKIKLSVTTTGTTFSKMLYQWDNGQAQQSTTNNIEVTVPNGNIGDVKTLLIQGMGADGSKSSAKKYYFKLAQDTEVGIDVYDGSTKLSTGTTYTKAVGSKLKISVTVTGSTFKELAYQWDSESGNKSQTNNLEITVPNYSAGSSHTLLVQGSAADGKKSDPKRYTIKIPDAVVESSVDINVYDGSTKLSTGTTYTKAVGSKLKISVTVTNGSFKELAYQWDSSTGNKSTTNNLEISVPNFEAGSTHNLLVQGSAADGKKSDSKTYKIKIPDAVVDTTVDVDVYDGSTKLTPGNTYTKAVGSKLTVKGTTNKTFDKLVYQWDDGTAQVSNSANVDVTVPNFEAGSSHTLLVQASATDGNKSPSKRYTIKIPDAEVPTYSGTVSASSPNGPLSENKNKPSELKAGDPITAKFEPEDSFSKFEYNWNDGIFQDLPANRKISVPNFEPGTTNKLTIRGTLKDGKVVEKIYYITIPKEEEHNPDKGGELIIDPWMRKNEDAEGLLVALRNGSDEDKANKNFYMIDEEVIYYVDYLNAGKEINDEVKLVLNLPLSFDVVDSDGGEVDKDKKTITWTFPYGLVEGAEDTKVVRIKYTSLSKKSLKSEMIYPQAVIYQKSKAKDYSAVINCIYLDEDTKFNDTHEPYMYGDLEAPTFRPDDGIKRVEGAMVLLRIFGEDYLSVKNITTKYSDIEETYKMGQQAITKATQLGIMSGYPDGSFKPNDKMTRAEFMRVIASYVAESADVKGLELKDNTAITVYNNKQSKNHWSNPYVTLLARLNMTSASEKEKDLKVDNTITRAEVAQLCNFYLFRAPAKVTSSTRIDFTDVNRSHKLLADIVEATRESHDYVVTAEGREIAK